MSKISSFVVLAVIECERAMVAINQVDKHIACTLSKGVKPIKRDSLCPERCDAGSSPNK